MVAGREGQCSDIHLPDIMPLGHLIPPRDRPGLVAGVMMSGALVFGGIIGKMRTRLWSGGRIIASGLRGESLMESDTRQILS